MRSEDQRGRILAPVSHGFIEGGTVEGAVLGLAILALIRTHPDPAAFARSLQALTAEMQLTGLTMGIPSAFPPAALEALRGIADEGFDEAARRAAE